MRAEGWGSLGSSLQTLGRGNPGNSKGLSQTPKYPTPKLQFTPDLDCVGDCRGKSSRSRGKRRIFLLLAAAAVEGGAHNMAGTKKAEGRSEREEGPGERSRSVVLGGLEKNAGCKSQHCTST